MFVSELVFCVLCVQILPDLLALSDGLAEVLGGAGPSGADKWSTSNWSIVDQWSTPGEDQRAAEAVRAGGHPAEAVQAAGQLVGEGLAVAGEGVGVAGEGVGVAGQGLASGSVEARSSQLFVCKLTPASWRNTVHSRRENNLMMMMMKIREGFKNPSNGKIPLSGFPPPPLPP